MIVFVARAALGGGDAGAVAVTVTAAVAAAGSTFGGGAGIVGAGDDVDDVDDVDAVVGDDDGEEFGGRVARRMIPATSATAAIMIARGRTTEEVGRGFAWSPSSSSATAATGNEPD